MTELPAIYFLEGKHKHKFRGKKKDHISIETFALEPHYGGVLIPHSNGTEQEIPPWRPPTVEEVEGDDTPLLTTDDFWNDCVEYDKIGVKTKDKLPFFIKFFGPDCEECDTFAPIWK